MSHYLGIDGGGTGTTALCVDDRGAVVVRHVAGPCNVQLLDDRQLLARFRQIRAATGRIDAVCLGLAGLRTADDKRRAGALVRKVWPGARAYLTHDLEIALAAANGKAELRVLVLSGTGSCCYGQRDGKEAKVGGWGHLLGDRGSGYDLALRTLRELIFAYEQKQNWPALGAEILRQLALNSPEELISWAASADKGEIAELAPVVFNKARASASFASAVIAKGAEDLAGQASLCARRLDSRVGEALFVFAGSVFRNQPSYVKRCQTALGRLHPKARFEVLTDSPAVGACRIAAGLSEQILPSIREKHEGDSAKYSPVSTTRVSPTEERNPRSITFAEMRIAEAVELMLQEESAVPGILLQQRNSIEKAIKLIVAAFQKRGRLFYVGAGTSGRLGALDASECPPTFRTDPAKVQGIIAGGQKAFWRAVEGAEDNIMGGREAIRSRGVSAADVVMGIAASGRTPFVWGAIEEAKALGAKTVLLCFNPYLKIPTKLRPDVVIAADLGGEVLTGSTRLKAGTATKLVLNIFTTVAMAKLGKVVGNLMVDLNPSNLKLRDRATRIVKELTGCDEAQARTTLERNGWVVKRAIETLRKKKRT